MFSGIIVETGKIESINSKKGVKVINIFAKKMLEGLKIGNSIAVNGVCLTVSDLKDNSFTVDVIPETLRLTNIDNLSENDQVNLEPSLQAGDKIDGHFVMGHIDGQGEITNITDQNGDVIYQITPPENLNKFIAAKGSITVDGISFTISNASKNDFKVALIPHTLKTTNLLERKVGDKVNLEIDVIARYLNKLTNA